MAGSDQFPPDIALVPHLIAKQIASGSSSPNPPPVADLAESIGEITVRTETAGASFLTVTVIDSQLRFLNHGFLQLVPSGPAAGLLDAIRIEFPVGSGSFWVLCAADISTDQSTPNLTLTFEDQSIWQLRQYWGTLGPRTTTILQFIQTLVQEASKPAPGCSAADWIPINFVCPELKAYVDDSKPAKTPGQRNRNKQPGIDKSAPLTSILSAPTGPAATLTGDQASNITAAISIAKSLNAPLLATQALLCAGFGESGWKSGVSNGTYGGVLGGNIQSAFKVNDVAGMVTAFLQGGKGYQQGGAIAVASRGPLAGPINLAASPFAQASPGYIALVVEGSDQPGTKQAWGDGGDIAAGTAYYGDFLPVVNEILAHSGAISAFSPSAVSIAAGSGSGPSWMPATPFQRGGTANPGEDSWDCIQRILRASPPSSPGVPLGLGTTWSAFSNVDCFYVMNGHDMISQKPAAYIDPANNVWWATSSLTSGSRDTYDTSKHYGDVISLTGIFDNTAFIYASTKKHGDKIQRKSRISKPATPTELTLELVCGIDEFRAGQVFYIRNFGPATGKWIVTDATRNVMADTFTTFTLEPPVDQNSSSTLAVHANSPVGAADAISVDGTVAGGHSSPAASAMAALANRPKYAYQEARPMPPGLFGASPPSAGANVPIDCSAFVTLCYKDAGYPDPNGPAYNYNGQGFTGSLAANSDRVTNQLPGDLCFYGAGPDYQHVTIHVGNGMVVSQGGPPGTPGPAIGPAATMGPSPFAGYFRPRLGTFAGSGGLNSSTGKPNPINIGGPIPAAPGSGTTPVTPAPGYVQKPGEPPVAPPVGVLAPPKPNTPATSGLASPLTSPFGG